MIRRPQNITLSIQSGTVMLCFLLIVGTVSSLGYVGRQALSTTQDRVRDLTAGQTAIRTAERAMLERELSLLETLAGGTPESLAHLERANQDAIATVEDLRRLPILDQQALADAASVLVSTTRWMELKAQPLLERFREAHSPADRGRLLMDYLSTMPVEQFQLSPEDSLNGLSGLVVARLTEARAERDAAIDWLRAVSALAAVLVALAALAAFAILHYRVSAPIRRFAKIMDRLANDDLSVAIPFQNRLDEIGAMSRALLIFRNLAISQNEDLQVKRALASFSTIVQEQKDLQGFAEVSVTALAENLGASVACFYSFEEHTDTLRLFATYGYSADGRRPTRFALGEGLVGQAARDKKTIMLSPAPADYIKVTSGLGSAVPGLVLVVPVTVLDRLIGVMEFGTFQPFDSVRRRIIEEASTAVALPLENLKRALVTRRLLEQSRRQTEELQAAEEELRSQQEELETANGELARRGSQLERSRHEALTRAEELEQTSQYKSRFLANMSHELRTPLNSMLILAQDLSENTDGNLDAQQVEAAKVIHTSGISLLRLINEILDLSKIEAGKIEVVREQMSLASLCQTLERRFRPFAEQKGVEFRVERDAGLPATICTDTGRMQQIANNLIGNALKFTREGIVCVTLMPAESGKVLSFVVSDTGVGIPPDKLDAIFQPFEQVDASTQRQFGGTGLGLAISRQLALLLGGSLKVESVQGEGSVFALNVPINCDFSASREGHGSAPPRLEAAEIVPAMDPNSSIAIERAPPQTRSGRTVLLVEDDMGSQIAISQLLSREGISVVSALNAEEALEQIDNESFSCLILDIGLPSLSGFEMLDILAQRGKTLPVVIYSARDMLPEEVMRLRGHTDSIILKGEHSEKRLLEEVREFLDLGAPLLPRPDVQPTTTPSITAAPESDLIVAAPSQQLRCKVLLVDDDMRNIYALAKVLRARGMEVVLAQDGLKALSELDANPDVQIVLMDMMMPNMDGYEAMTQIRRRGGKWINLPIIALTAKAMKEDREKCLEAGASDYLTKPIDLQRLLVMIREQLAHGR